MKKHSGSSKDLADMKRNTVISVVLTCLGFFILYVLAGRNASFSENMRNAFFRYIYLFNGVRGRYLLVINILLIAANVLLYIFSTLELFKDNICVKDLKKLNQFASLRRTGMAMICISIAELIFAVLLSSVI